MNGPHPLKGRKQTAEHIAKRVAAFTPKLKGRTPWNKGQKTGYAPWRGKKRSAEDRQKMSESRLRRRDRLGYINSPEAVQKMAAARRGKSRPLNVRLRMSEYIKDHPIRGKGWHHSEETLKKLSIAKIGRPIPALRGANNAHWKGGITPLHRQIRHSLEYAIWRRAVFERDDYRCFDCGAKSGETSSTVVLEADHIYPFAQFPRLRFMVENGRTLCNPCHRIRTSAQYSATAKLVYQFQ